jgi:hypothetical protein
MVALVVQLQQTREELLHSFHFLEETGVMVLLRLIKAVAEGVANQLLRLG